MPLHSSSSTTREAADLYFRMKAISFICGDDESKGIAMTMAAQIVKGRRTSTVNDESRQLDSELVPIRVKR